MAGRCRPMAHDWPRREIGARAAGTNSPGSAEPARRRRRVRTVLVVGAVGAVGAPSRSRVVVQIHPDAARWQGRARGPTAHRCGRGRRPEGDVAAELRPRGHLMVDLRHRRGHRGRQFGRLEDAEHERHLVPGAETLQFAAVKSPSRPWNSGRSGSRSNRSTSSRPRSLVSMSTGSWRARAASRTSSLHRESRTPRSRYRGHPQTSWTVSGVTPAVSTSMSRYGSSSAILRAADYCLVDTKIEKCCRYSVQI